MLIHEEVRLCPFERQYSEQTRLWMNHAELARNLGRDRFVTELEHQRWYESVVTNPNHLFFAILFQDTHIGNVWLWDICRRNAKAEVRILIGHFSHQNKGLGTKALNLMANFAFETLNLHKLYAYVLGFNERAKKAFEKAEFCVEGILKQDRWLHGSYVDVYLLGRLK